MYDFNYIILFDGFFVYKRRIPYVRQLVVDIIGER